MRAVAAHISHMSAVSPSSCLPLPEGEAFHSIPSLPRLPTEPSRPTTPDGSQERNDVSRSKPRFKMVTTMITPEEFDALPPSIQKKYFSSVERLRIAQQSAAQKRKKQQSSSEAWLSPKPSLDSVRPKTHGLKSSSVSTYYRKAQYRRTNRTEADVDEEQALRFLALPDKLKRSHFTPEELVLLTESSERVLGTPAWMSEDDFHRRMTLDRNSSISSSQFPTSDSEGPIDDIEKGWQVEVESVASSEQCGEKGTIAQRRGAQRRQGSLSSTHGGLPLRDRKRYERPFSRKRAMSLAPLPLPPPTLRPAVPPLPTSVSSTHLALGSPQAIPEGTSQSTRYYKDSDARQKLREYLASPEKFDEALEFGFPSEPSNVERSISIASSSAPALQSDHDGLSVFDSRDEEADEDEEMEEEHDSAISPRTPLTGQDVFNPSITNHSSLDSGVALPFASIKPGPRSVSPDICGREMTLRMTLTRPDLRAPERELYAFQRKEVSGVDVETIDPLALESLPVCDDHSGAHGAFAVAKPSGGFMKALKNFRIR